MSSIRRTTWPCLQSQAYQGELCLHLQWWLRRMGEGDVAPTDQLMLGGAAEYTGWLTLLVVLVELCNATATGDD